MGGMAKAKVTPSTKQSKLARVFPYLLIVAGIIGIICSLILTHDQIAIWQNPNYHPSCSLNPIVSCGTVIDSKQGHIFGIPAPFYGLMMFPVLVFVGVAMLAGAKFKRWFWLLVQAGAVGGIVFALWLFWLSLYTVHALCPFCLTVDVAVYAAAWYITLYNIEQKVITVPAQLQKLARWARQHHLDLLILWYLIVFVWIMHHFWYYFGKHLPF